MIPVYKVLIFSKSINLAAKTLKSGWIGGDGPKVKEFEQEIAKLIKNPNVVAVNSATSALELALHIVGVRGYEVITTPTTCFATNAAIINEGGQPVWADVDPSSGNIDPSSIEERITDKTKAIVVVHAGGTPCDLDRINKIAKLHNIPVIEDAAGAFGAEYNNKPIGNHSDFVVFSFQATKIITTIDGGILAVKKMTDKKRAKILRWYGIDREARKYGSTFWDYPIAEVGFKMQMTDVSAAIGLGQLPSIGRNLARRRRIASIYQKELKKSKILKAQKELPNTQSNYWVFTILCGTMANRKKLVRKLKDMDVEALELFRRNDSYPVFSRYNKGRLAGVEKFDQTHLIIPIGEWVSFKKAREIAQCLSKF